MCPKNSSVFARILYCWLYAVSYIAKISRKKNDSENDTVGGGDNCLHSFSWNPCQIDVYGCGKPKAINHPQYHKDTRSSSWYGVATLPFFTWACVKTYEKPHDCGNNHPFTSYFRVPLVPSGFWLNNGFIHHPLKRRPFSSGTVPLARWHWQLQSWTSKTAGATLGCIFKQTIGEYKTYLFMYIWFTHTYIYIHIYTHVFSCVHCTLYNSTYLQI